MSDIKIVKTNNIEKVKQEKNQVIVCKDGSIYFDYSLYLLIPVLRKSR